MKIAMFFLMLAAPSPKDYPLRIRILQIEEHHSKWGTTGEGRANLKEVDGMIHGIDFQFECDHGFKASVGPGGYRALLKKPERLEVLSTEIGGDKVRTCEWKYTPRRFMYTMHDGIIGSKPAEESKPTETE